ncbi:MAG: hypothetical protein JOZ37_15660 [Actinobacteria bacterium]|nr:hypothetical protein [Actinomycetota bacterium]
MTRRVLLGVVAICLVPLAACGGHHQTDAEKLRAAMARTSLLSRQFVYSDVTGNTRTEVKGLIADDFRYKAATTINGLPIWEEVVDDDAIADRALSNAAFAVFGRQAAPAAQGSSAPAQSVSASQPVESPSLTPQVRDALLAHRWVLDSTGAPSLLPSATEHHPLGADPVFDALTVFRYVDQSIREAFQVKKFNADSLDYKPSEDPFPKPKKHSGVSRYDFERPRLPRPQDISGASANQRIPTAANFRKMAVYVKDGRVIQVLEQIDVVSRLEELQRNYNVKIPSSLPSAQRVKIAIDAINAVRAAQGSDVIRVRTMSLQLVDLGKPVTVALPTDAVDGSLSAFENRGRATGSPTTPTTTAGG